jgi:hypothetical protein
VKEHNSNYKILAQSPNACVLQCSCCTQIQVQYKNVMICFEWKDLIGFIQRLDNLPPNHPYYIVNLIDLRCYPMLKFGVSTSAICLIEKELEELSTILSLAYGRMDLGIIFQKSLHNN